MHVTLCWEGWMGEGGGKTHLRHAKLLLEHDVAACDGENGRVSIVGRERVSVRGTAAAGGSVGCGRLVFFLFFSPTPQTRRRTAQTLTTGAERDSHGVGELVDAPLNLDAGLHVEGEVLGVRANLERRAAHAAGHA